MPFGGLLTAGAIVGSGTAGVISGGKQSNATAYAADKQYQAAQDAIAASQKQQAYAVQLAGATPQEIGMINQQITAQQASYQTQLSQLQQAYQTLNSYAPEVQEAGKQSLQLMQGQQAAILQPILDQRARDRQTLQNQLQQTLGSGYATSSVGQKALLNFDVQTQDQLTNAQNQALTTMASISQSGTSLLSQGFGNLAVANSNLANNFLAAPLQAVQNIQNRITNAATGTQTNYGQILGQGTQGYMTAAQNANAGIQSLSNTLGSLGSAGLSYLGTQQLLNQQSQNLSSLFPKNSTGSSSTNTTGTVSSLFRSA